MTVAGLGLPSSSLQVSVTLVAVLMKLYHDSNAWVTDGFLSVSEMDIYIYSYQRKMCKNAIGQYIVK